jgi:hypothetical protein
MHAMDSVPPPPPVRVAAARPVAGAPEPTDPLSPAHWAALRAALAARRPLRRAVRTARLSAITLLGIGILGLPLLPFFFDVISLIVVAGLCVLGICEWAGAERLREGQPGAAAFLGRNQLCLIGLITAYCVVQMATFKADAALGTLLPADVQSQLSPVTGVDQEVADPLQGILPTRGLIPLLTYGFYGIVIAASVIAQGSLALYYFTRQRHVDAWQRSTAPWITRLLVEMGL